MLRLVPNVYVSWEDALPEWRATLELDGEALTVEFPDGVGETEQYRFDFAHERGFEISGMPARVVLEVTSDGSIVGAAEIGPEFGRGCNCGHELEL
ncbi:MAG: hypothetical protein ACOZNI_01890 [Myxococcota bacterium]